MVLKALASAFNILTDVSICSCPWTFLSNAVYPFSSIIKRLLAALFLAKNTFNASASDFFPIPKVGSRLTYSFSPLAAVTFIASPIPVCSKVKPYWLKL